MENILEATGISKHFTGVQALDNVDLRVRKGEVHVLLGENGAGKSTLLKIISGLYTADKGQIMFKGEEMHFKHPIEAKKAGIATVYQELTVLPYLTVAQNIFLNEEQNASRKKSRVFTDENMMLIKVKELAEQYGIEIDPYALVGDLPIAKQQTAEILKALVVDPELVILDEPTSALGREEVDKLYAIIKNLQAAGKTILFISHRMEEVFRFGERATIFKDGELIDTVNLSEVVEDDLIRLMVGRNLDDIFPKKSSDIKNDILFEAKKINLKGKLHDVDLLSKRGEILGLAGLQGQGQTELLRSLSGIISTYTGDVMISGKKQKIKSPGKASRNGIAYIPEDRKRQALFLGLSVRDNLAASSLYKRQKATVIDRKAEGVVVDENIKLLNIKTPTPEQYVLNLSGGNQQKVVLGKGLALNPKILLFNEPTRGIDVEAKQEIYRLLRKFADEGLSVILYSSDLIEIVGLCDRVITMYEGRVTAELVGDMITEENIMRGSVGFEIDA
jgi:ABC-type sugar transport system ATPase subunit